MNQLVVGAASEVSVDEGIAALQRQVEECLKECVLLQSQCIGNPLLANVLQNTASLTNAMSVYSNAIARDRIKLFPKQEGPE